MDEITDDVIQSTQYYIKYINSAVLINLQCGPLKFGRLKKICSHGNSLTKKPFLLGRSGTQYAAMVTKPLTSYCGAHLVESYHKESNISDTHWLRYFFSLYLIKIWLSV